MKLCYLDNSATTRPLDSVVEAMTTALKDEWYNPSAAYESALQAEKKREEARRSVLVLLGKPGRLIFTSGGTEADNLALFGSLPKGAGHYITTSIEHPAILEAMQELSRRGNAVTVLPVDSAGQVDIHTLRDAVRDDTVLVSIMHVNNETGAVQDIGKLASAVKEINPNALFHSDGVQAFGRVPFGDCRAVDLYSVSAHKIHGPKGVGALYVREGVRIRPLLFGGGQEEGWRSGTENMPGIIGFGEAARQFSLHQSQWIQKLYEMKRQLAEGLLRIPDTGINGPGVEEGAPHILNLFFAGVPGATLLNALQEVGVLVSTASACKAKGNIVSPVLLAHGLDKKRAQSSLRFSLSVLNTPEDIEYAVEQVTSAVTRLRKFTRR